MGSGNTKQNEQIKVPRTQGRYPPPLPPKWFLPEISSILKPPIPPTTQPTATHNIEWDELEVLLETEVEEGIDNVDNDNTTTELPRPHSVLATPRINTGIWKNKTSRSIGQRPKLKFTQIDEHAKLATAKDAITFESLIAYLSQPIRSRTYPNTCLVRGLIVWLANNHNVKSTRNKAGAVNSPNGILQYIRNKSLTFTEGFVLICRAAKIPTVIIPGRVKAGKYEPGDLIGEEAIDTWCAVHVDGSWQIIHPTWVCLGTYGSTRGGRVLIEDDPSVVAKEEKVKKKNKNSITTNDEFFMPRPDVFVYKCFAKDEQWRLIPKERNLQSLDEFMTLVYMSSSFFKLGLTLTSQPFCVQTAINGVARIEILAPSHISNKLDMEYKLDYDIETFPDDEEGFKPTRQQALLLQKKVLQKFVVNYRSNDKFVFEVRLPVPGVYKFDIMGGIENLANLCRFKLICHDYIGEWFINPYNPGRHCWGPGPLAEDVGLLLPSKPSGLLKIQSKNSSGVLRERSVYHHLTTLQFHINRTLFRKYEFSAEVVPSTYVTEQNIETEVLTNGDIKTDTERQKAQKKGTEDDDVDDDDAYPVKVQVNRDYTNRQITFQVVGRMDGSECMVVIKATEMEMRNSMKVPVKNSTKAVCYYLLTANNGNNREPTDVKLARTALQEAMLTEDIGQVQNALTKCFQRRIPDSDDEIAAAESKLEYLQLRRDIIDCVKRRNVTIITDTLKKVVGYRYRDGLVVEVEKLLAFRSELQNLQGYAKKLPTIREAIEELYKLSCPTKLVHNTLKALCILLGYDETLKDWNNIKVNLKPTQNKRNEMTILKRMEYMDSPTFPWHSMDVDVLDKVNSTLRRHPLEHVNYVSQAAATVYKWIERMLDQAKGTLRQRLTEKGMLTNGVNSSG